MQPLYEYVCHLKGHRNSKGELAEWVIKSHETGEILSSHKSEKKAKEHLQQMHIFKESVDSMSYKLLGETTYGTDMDKRVKIFMEGVSQLGLSKNQVDAIGKITNACMEGVVGNMELTRDEQAYEHLLQCLHDMDIPDETIEIATHILGDSKETLIKIGNAVATMINNGDRSFRDNFCFDIDHKTGKVKFCMEGVGRRPIPYIEDRATATNPDPNYRIMYRELVDNGFSRDTLNILTTILGATVDTLKKIVQAKHELEERDNMRIPAEAFRDWDNKHDNSDDNEELGSMGFAGDFGYEGDLGEIGKISERDEETPNF